MYSIESAPFKQMSSMFFSLVPGRVFIPNYISRVKVQLVDCNTKNRSGETCPVLLKIRSRAPPVHNSSAMDCRENVPCELDVPLPSWEQWYYILVERYLSSSDVYFRIGVQVKGKSLKLYIFFINEHDKSNILGADAIGHCALQ